MRIRRVEGLGLNGSRIPQFGLAGTYIYVVDDIVGWTFGSSDTSVDGDVLSVGFGIHGEWRKIMGFMPVS